MGGGIVGGGPGRSGGGRAAGGGGGDGGDGARGDRRGGGGEGAGGRVSRGCRGPRRTLTAQLCFDADGVHRHVIPRNSAHVRGRCHGLGAWPRTAHRAMDHAWEKDRDIIDEPMLQGRSGFAAACQIFFMTDSPAARSGARFTRRVGSLRRGRHTRAPLLADSCGRARSSRKPVGPRRRRPGPPANRGRATTDRRPGDRLEAKPGTGMTGSFAICATCRQGQFLELGRAQRRPREAGLGDDPLRRDLAPK